MKSHFDFGARPYVVIWEATRACALACVHCRASAQALRDPNELDTSEAKALIDEIANFKPPVFVITGGDPLQRDDLFELITYAVEKDLRTSITPSVTPRLTADAISSLGAAGVARIALSLDGSCATVHDDFRRVSGSFDDTLRASADARRSGIPLQINTTISRRNLHDLGGIMQLVAELDIALWSVFFLVPTGRGETEQMLDAAECEEVFAQLHALSKVSRFGIKTTEAMHYRRYMLQNSQTLPPSASPSARAPRGINDGKGFVFISHVGDVYPSGFLPAPAGNVRRESLLAIYRDSPLFVSLRDTSLLRGKCGMCEFRNICGGSRARALAVYGDILAEDPACAYEPSRALPRIA